MPTVSESPSPNNQPVEINGRDYHITDRETVDDLERMSPQLAAYWRRRGIVARCEVRLARRARRSYLVSQYRDGSWSKPWRGMLTVNQ